MFDFEVNLKGADTLVLFTGQLEGVDGYYGSKIDTILKNRNKLYNDIILLFPSYIAPQIQLMLVNGSKLESNIKRDSRVSQISLITFDGYADLQIFKNLITNDAPPACLEKLKHELVTFGLWSLIASRKDKVILKSPSGTIFQKPSGDRYSEFIKASDLAVGFSENQFVAFALLAHRPKRKEKHAIQHIWIDTSGISSYIESLIYYITKFNGDEFRSLQYHSFQSYGKNGCGGYKACLPQTTDNIWVIISASSSNNMGVDICKERESLQHDQIVTLLSYTDSKGVYSSLCGSDVGEQTGPIRKGDNIVVNIAKFSDADKFEKKYGSEVPVEIIGENFTAQVEAPTTVLLRQAHAPKEIKKFVECSNHGTYLCAYKKHRNRLRPVFFDFEKFNNSDCDDPFYQQYKQWLKNIVNWYIPRTVGTVIYDKNDAASCLLLEHVQSLIDFKDIEKLDINSAITIHGDLAIIALLPVMTKGNTLVKLNSDLRLANHSAQRIFITPFIVCSSREAYEAMVNSLTFAPKGLKYQFANFRQVFIGHQEDQCSWEQELAMAEGFGHSIWRARAQRLRTQSQGMDTIGISCTPNQDKLIFNKDFAFWLQSYDPSKVNQTTVYVTVSAILQNLREKLPTASNKESLYAQAYQHSVLDPANFSRFNDPLLQSCLWRCAYDRELDYRSRNDLSQQFSNILIRLAQYQARGELTATLDLLVGIAVQKIQLSKDCLQGLITRLNNTLADKDEFTEILGFIDGGFKSLKSDEDVY